MALLPFRAFLVSAFCPLVVICSQSAMAVLFKITQGFCVLFLDEKKQMLLIKYFNFFVEKAAQNKFVKSYLFLKIFVSYHPRYPKKNSVREVNLVSEKSPTARESMVLIFSTASSSLLISVSKSGQFPILIKKKHDPCILVVQF